MGGYGVVRRGFIALAATAALVACELEPGHASLEFAGELSGQVDGAGVTCPPPGSVQGDASALWIWSGTVNGHSAAVTAAALNTTAIPDSLLIRSGNTYWFAAAQPAGSAAGPGKFTARVSDGKVLQIDGIASSFSSPNVIEIHGAMRCPR
jgi:hypothetical protein